MTIPAFPLQWPAGWKRTPAHLRTRARFGKQQTRYSSHVQPDGSRNSYKLKAEVTIADGVSRIRAELARMGVSDDDLVISTDLQLRLDGLPRSGQREPDDPGVAVYWLDTSLSGHPRCMAIDRYDRVADNLAAVAATLDAMRAIERHGGAEILERAFTGFTALGHDGSRKWWDVLGVPSDAKAADVEAAYRRRRAATHPDRGGDATEFAAVQKAWEEARTAP
jgi:hypothetical protein